jgi:uncharacterized phiE125 gp8 family phage protein
MASLSLVTAPVYEPISVQEAKEHCRIDLSDEDAAIEGFVQSERQHIETVTARAFITQRWALRLDGWPCWIDVPRPPLINTEALPVVITYVDTAGVTQTLAADQYRIDAPAGLTCVRGRIEPAYGVTWPTLQCVMSSVTVTFWAGYGASGDMVPRDLRDAILLRVLPAYARRPMDDNERRAYRSKIAPYMSRPVQRQ